MRHLLRVLSAPLFLASAQAHVVPNMTIEADFTTDHSYTLRINLDPRVFLSDQPTSLPPVSADWYLNQTDSEKAATYTKATEYLKANIGLTFSDQTVPVPACEFVAMDGATNEVVKPDTAETHLLATAKGTVPAGADHFKLAFGKTANVSLILINGVEGNPERKPQVIFPGETSRPFQIPQPSQPEKGQSQVAAMDSRASILSIPSGVLAAACAFGVVLLAAGAFLMRPKRR